MAGELTIKFEDGRQRTWSLELDALAVEAIRADVDPEFLRGNPQETFARLGNDPAQLCHVVYVLCRDQLRERGIEQKDFYFALRGSETLDRAWEAVAAAIVGFIPSRAAKVIAALLTKERKIAELGTEQILARIEDPRFVAAMLSRLTAETDQNLSEIGLTLSDSATATPDSSGSAPAD